MAVAGSGGWIPSTEVCIKNGELLQPGYTQNTPRDVVQIDMSLAAAQLRRNPTELIRVDAKKVYLLKNYLLRSGHIHKR